MIEPEALVCLCFEEARWPTRQKSRCPKHGEARKTVKPPKAKPKPAAVSPASTAQRVANRTAVCIVTGSTRTDPAHLWPRAQGGCDDPLCTVPLRRDLHRLFDAGNFDVLPYLIAGERWAEIAHMVEVHHADPIHLLERLTGARWQPVPDRKAAMTESRPLSVRLGWFA